MSHPMTITEKILAAHAGVEYVVPGDLIKVNVDLALANDITAPLAIRVFREIGREKAPLLQITLFPTRTFSRLSRRNS